MSTRRPFTCETCCQSFTRSENLERHKRSRHGGGARRSYECDRCLARFSRRDVCKRHAERCQGRSDQQQFQEQSRAPDEWNSLPQTVDDTASILALLATPAAPSAMREHLTFENNHFATDITPTTSPSASSTYSLPLPSIIEICNSLNLLIIISLQRLSVDSTTTHTRSFFKNFHPSLPLVHRPTFTVSSTPKVLINITAVIGSLYTSEHYGAEDQIACANWRRRLWQQGHDELTRIASSDWLELRKIWVMQAWLLHVVYGAFIGDGSHFEEAKKMLRSLVDAVRELGLLRQSIAFPNATCWITTTEWQPIQNHSTQLHERWMSYVDEESMRISLYTLLFLDAQISSPCNIRPLISPIEFGWELPYSSTLWEANNSHVWLQRISEEYDSLGLSTTYGKLRFPRGAATSSLSLATQDLMSEYPSPELMATLQASPIATLYILTNVDLLVRDFTRCYYQLPPTLSDPSAFHILTQSQNRQVMAVVRAITKISQDHSQKKSQTLLWHSIELMTWSIKVSLWRPDDLLIGGVVDSSLMAGLATATHLTLGSYVAVRRSALSSLQQKSSDDGVLTVLSELLYAMSAISEDSGALASWEAPWSTVATFRIILMIWQALRQAASEIRKYLKSFNNVPRKFEPSMLIFRAITETVMRLKSEHETSIQDSCLQTDNPADLAVILDKSETLFMKFMLKACRHRIVWAIGPSMATVVEEIMATPPPNV